jgi:hypothetical protein
MLPEDRYLDYLLTLDQARVAAEDGRVASAHLRLYRGLEMAQTDPEPWSRELRRLYLQALTIFQRQYPWPSVVPDDEDAATRSRAFRAANQL